MTAYDETPGAWRLPTDFPRHDPTAPQQREAVLDLVSRAPWAELGWPDLIESLVSIGRADIPLARLAEGHVDAVRILGEAGAEPDPGALYGVWASRSRSSGLTATSRGDDWVLDGVLEFTSGAGIVDRALVPVRPPHGESVLLDLPVDGWVFDDSRWLTRAMELSRTHRVILGEHLSTAHEIAEPGWYLSRRGFFPGGVGVAAVWAGGAARVADLLRSTLPVDRRTAAQSGRLGRIRTDVAGAVAIVREAAARIDDDDDAHVLRRSSVLARGGVAGAVRRVLDEARTLAGPVGLSADLDLIRAVDDLGLYVAQHNADADGFWLGEAW